MWESKKDKHPSVRSQIFQIKVFDMDTGMGTDVDSACKLDTGEFLTNPN